MEKNEGLPLVLCGAKAKRTGKLCRQPAMKNGRCSLHGGKSTGPKTLAGREKIRAVNTISGAYAISALCRKKKLKKLLKIAANNLSSI